MEDIKTARSYILKQDIDNMKKVMKKYNNNKDKVYIIDLFKELYVLQIETYKTKYKGTDDCMHNLSKVVKNYEEIMGKDENIEGWKSFLGESIIIDKNITPKEIKVNLLPRNIFKL